MLKWIILCTATMCARPASALVADAMDHPVRRQILEMMTTGSGAAVSELVRRLDVTRTAVLHHLRVLERAGLIAVVSVEGRKYALPPNHDRSPVAVRITCRGNEREAMVLKALAAAPEGMRRSQLHAALVEIPARTRNHVLRRLVERGIVQESSHGPERSYRLCGKEAAPRATEGRNGVGGFAQRPEG